MKSNTDRALSDLEILNLCIALDVQHVLQASMVTFAANHLFRREPTLFAWNPGNTLPYMALQALEERAIVDMAEVIKEKQNLVPEGTVIRRKLDLIAHRHGLSHPLTVKWDRPWMQTFFDQERQWRDLRPALVWDMQRSLNEELKKHGRNTMNENVEVTDAMAMCLELILKLSMRDANSVPSARELLDRLRTFKDAYVTLLVENPDGKP